MPPKSKKPAAKKATPAKKKAGPDPLFPSRPKTFQIGQDILPRKMINLTRFVKWPRYIRIQRQRAVLYTRLKVPPSINQFASKALNKNQATTVFTLLNKYRPDTPAVKAQKLKEIAAAKAENKEATTEKAPHQIKFGLKHVTTLIEEKKAVLVVIANNVDPIECVMWLPALCRKMGVPFCIIKDKGRLGALVHLKNAACLALTGVDKADQSQLELLQSTFKEQFNDNPELVRKWGGGIMGAKTQAKLDKRAKAVAIEDAKKAATLGRA